MNSKYKEFIIAALLFSFVISFVPAQSFFNENLTEDERALLDSGKTVIKNTGSYKKMCISSENPGVKKAVGIITDLKPAYFAEIIKVYPYKGNENLLEKFSGLVMDIPSYAGIPYYSERAEKWYDLYTSAEIKSVNKSGNIETVNADFDMKPFGLVQMKITSETPGDYYYYESTNLSTMRYYDKFNCVNPENMKSIIVIFRSDDKWILYGIGAVKAPSVFFLRDRVDTSFMNRIKTFCAHFFTKMENGEQ